MFNVIGYMDKFTTCGNTLHVVKRSKRLQIAQRLKTAWKQAHPIIANCALWDIALQKVG